jgi:hypothetical protein
MESGNVLVHDEFWRITGSASEGTIMTLHPIP